MRFLSLFRTWASRSPRPALRSARRRRLEVEALEDRCLLSLGAAMVQDIVPGADSSNPGALAVVNGTVFFAADGPAGRELWKSDGSAAGTAMVKDIYPGRFSSSPANLTKVGNTLFFTADDGTHGAELWKSNGSAAGTVMVKDIIPFGAGSHPAKLTDVGGELFFTASDPAHGTELWKSDGTQAGTKLVRDINPGTGGSNIKELVDANGTLFFTANDGIHGGLWRSDGTQAGTTLIPISGGFPQQLTYDAANGFLFFTAGFDLWRSKGTAITTHDVGTVAGAKDLTVVNGVLFFSAGVGYAGPQLWQSDGFSVSVVKPFGKPYVGSAPADLTAVGNTLFFSADDGVHGRELWKSDGTYDGTVLVKDLRRAGGSSPSHLTNVTGFLTEQLFFTASTNNAGVELYTSDGTSAGTKRVRDIFPGPGDSLPDNLTDAVVFNQTLFFTANDGVHGVELWQARDFPQPVVTNPGQQFNQEGDAVSLAISATGGTLTYSALNLPQGLTIDSATGVISGTLGNQSASVTHPTVLVINEAGFTAKRTFGWTVGDPTAPVLTTPPSQNDKEGTTVSLTVHATDADGDPLVYDAGNLPAGLSIDAATGVITGTIAANTAGLYSVDLSVTDGSNTATAIFRWTVRASTIPVLVSPGPQNNSEGDAVMLAISASDADGDPLTYSAGNLPPGLTIDSGTGVISGTVGNQAGSGSPYTVQVSVADDVHLVSTTFTWTVIDVTAPVVVNPGPQGNNEGNTVSLTIGAADADGDPLTFAASGLPADLAIDVHTGAIAGTLGPQAAGAYPVMVSVSDGQNTGTTSFTWTVADLTPPVVVNPGPQSNNEGNTIALGISASDADGDPLIYSASNLPTGLSIDAHTGKISGTPGPQAAGSYPVTVFVSDGSSIASVNFTWTIGDFTVPVVVNPGTQSNIAGDVVSLQIVASDADADPLACSAINLPPGLTIDASSGLISCTVDPAAASADYLVTVYASDGTNIGSVTFLWTITGLSLSGGK